MPPSPQKPSSGSANDKKQQYEELKQRLQKRLLDGIDPIKLAELAKQRQAASNEEVSQDQAYEALKQHLQRRLVETLDSARLAELEKQDPELARGEVRRVLELIMDQELGKALPAGTKKRR